jgi:hypothetical protein
VRRRVPSAVAGLLFVLGLAFTFFWDPVVHHSSTWFAQGDLWGTYRAAQYVAWGYLGGVYNQDTGMVTFPGIAVVLAPVAMLGGSLHLSASSPGFILARPTAALLLVPVDLALGATVLFASDAVAEELRIDSKRRRALCIVVGVLTFATVAVWGHPEDAVAMAFALYAMIAVLRGNWSRAGWLFGIGVAFQPLIALVLPLFLASSPRGGRLLFAIRCSVISVFLVVVSYLGNPSGTYRALLKQPTPPLFNHATPWVDLAPRVRLTGASASVAEDVTSSGRGHLHAAVITMRPLLQVSAGPGRTIYLVLAVVLALYVWRRPQDPIRLIWMAGFILAARCFFEAVMTPYYLTPPLIVLLVLVGRGSARRFRVAVGVAVGISWFAYWHLNPWVWWLPVVAGLMVILAVAFPDAAANRPTQRDSSLQRADGVLASR